MDLLEPRLHAHGHELSQVLAFIRGSDGSATFGFALFDLLQGDADGAHDFWYLIGAEAVVADIGSDDFRRHA